MQAIPIPESISLEEIEETFHHTAKQMHFELQEETDESPKVGENYFMVELPSGKTLVHVMEPDSKFPLQFARCGIQYRSTDCRWLNIW